MHVAGLGKWSLSFFLSFTPSGIKLDGIRNRMGMKFANKFNGTLVVKSQLFRLVTRGYKGKKASVKTFDC
eukprot:976506-Pelagomonas_calceolata.AAC.1